MTRLINVTLIVNEVDHKKEEEKEMKTKMRGQASFLPHFARLAFTEWRQLFTSSPIPYYLDPGRHIDIETDTSGYEIGEVLSQLSSNQQFSNV